MNKVAAIKKNGNITVGVECSNRANADGTYSIYLKITEDGKKRKQKIVGVYVLKRDHFNAKAKYGGWITSKDLLQAEKNKELKRLIESTEKKLIELQNEGLASKDSLMVRVNTEKKQYSFINFAEDFAKRTYEAGDIRIYKKYISFINKLKVFQDGKDILFSEIKLQHLNKFKAHLQTLRNERNKEYTIHQNTIAEQFKQYKSLYNKGIAELELTTLANPFKDFECKIIETTKEKLSEAEIRAIEALSLTPNTWASNSKNYFLFSFYCGGIRVGDLVQLRWSDITPDNRLEYVMDKTETKRDIKLYQKAINILDHYKTPDIKRTDFIFPILDVRETYAKADTQDKKNNLPAETKNILYNKISSANVLINKGLRVVKEKACIDKDLTMHIARHSFASIALNMGASLDGLQDVMAHTDPKITEKYAKGVSNKRQDEVMDKVFGDQLDIAKQGILKSLERLSTKDAKAILLEILKTEYAE